MLNTNDLAAGSGRIIDDTRGYYLIGFDTLDPDGRGVGSERHPHPRQAARAHACGRGAACSGRPTRTARATTVAGRSAGRRHALAVRHRRHRRPPHHAVRARRQGRLLRPLAVLHRSGRPDVRRRRRRPARGRPVAAAPRHRRQRPAVGQARMHVPLRLDDDAYALLRQRGLLYSARLCDQGAGRLPDPRRRAGRSLQGDRDERAVRRGAEGRQGPASRCRAS